MSGKKRDRHWSVAIHADIFVLADGVKIAKLGDPGTLQTRTGPRLDGRCATAPMD